jgi:hypothetical protein
MRNRGLSTLELVIALSILLVITALITSGFSSFRKSTGLNDIVENGMSLLSEARSKTLSSEMASQYGVHFETTKMVLFKGTSYSAGAPDNEELAMPPGVEIASFSNADVIFERLTGATSQNGTVVFRLISDPAKTRTITIQATGIAGR